MTGPDDAAQGTLRAPAAVRMIDLAQVEDVPVPRDGAPYTSAYIVGAREGRPVAGRTLELDGSGVISAAAIADAFVDAPDAVALAPSQRAVHMPTVSVVVTTCCEDESVAGTVASILACDPGPLEIIVVENRPADSTVFATLSERFGSDPRLRYIEEPRAGLSHARNAGLAVAVADAVAFTDDDVIVDPAWIDWIARSFASESDAACVTGLILPSELETPSQVQVEQFAGFGKGWARRVYRMSDPTSELFPFAAGEFGSGACTALRRDIALELNGFATELGAGTLARGGEDLDIYVRVLLAGHALVYEPAAVLWHRHRDSLKHLRRELFSYGIGFSAMVTKQMTQGQSRAILRSLPAGVSFLRDPASRKNVRKAPGYPRQFDWIERAGLVAGPITYLASRRQQKRLGGGGFLDGPGSRAWRQYQRAWIGEVDLASGLTAVSAPGAGELGAYRRARLLVRRGVSPVGLVEVPLLGGEASVRAIATEIDRQLGPQNGAEDDGAGFAGPMPSMSVVICTRERPESLRRTLVSLLAADVSDFEVVLVDNAPVSSDTRACVEALNDPRLKYVSEPVPGLSRARNRGIIESTGKIVAFTDDDVLLDPAWLRQLAGGFARDENVGCVTGLVLAAELETPEQAYFDSKVGWSSGMQPRRFDLETHRSSRPFFPYSAGEFGTGANFAVRRETFEEIGMFDEALGAGSPARGGEDLDFLARVVLRGASLAYEPSALTWHVHRRDLASLRSQLYGYGSGLGAYVFKQVWRDQAIQHLAGAALSGQLRSHGSGERGGAIRASTAGLRALELRGLAAGPLLYIQGKHNARKHPAILEHRSPAEA